MSEQAISSAVSWTTTLETYFARTAEKAHGLSMMHKDAEGFVGTQRTGVDIPVIVLSGVTGFVSALSSSPLLSANQGVVSVALGCVSLFVGILNTTGSYYQFAKRTEGHRISAIQWGKLFRFLNVEMSLPREERMNPHDLLKMTKETYDRLQEISPLLPEKVVEKFKNKLAKYKDMDIGVPDEANGLERVTVYVETPEMAIKSQPTSPPATLTLRLPEKAVAVSI